jgi:hypothetical protein
MSGSPSPRRPDPALLPSSPRRALLRSRPARPPFPTHTITAQREAELWGEWFIQRPGMPPTSCACVGVTSGTAGGAGGGMGAPNLEGVPMELVPLDAPEALRKVFDKLVSRVLKKRG